MEKIDFDILLLPSVTTSELKDISLVTGLAAIGQQIKNVVSMNEKELPFSQLMGANVLDYVAQNRANNIFLNESVNSALAYSLKNIYNVSSTFQNGEIPGTFIINVKFDYKTRTNLYQNNRVSITLNTI